MSNLAALQNELRSFAVEAKKRHPKLKDSAEHLMAQLKDASEASGDAPSASFPGGDALVEDLMKMLMAAHETKSKPLIQLVVGCLLKIVTMDGISERTFPHAITILRQATEPGQTEEQIQLRALQTALCMVQSTKLSSIPGPMSQTIELCILLHTHGAPVVSNTAAASFGRMVDMIMDQVLTLDQKVESMKKAESSQQADATPQTPVKGNNSETSESAPSDSGAAESVPDVPSSPSMPPPPVLAPPPMLTSPMSAILPPPPLVPPPGFAARPPPEIMAVIEKRDASVRVASFLIQEIVRLTLGGKDAPWTALKSMSQSLGLEALAAIVTNHREIFQEHQILANIVRDSVCPLISTFLMEGLNFPLWVRTMRLTSGVITRFANTLCHECGKLLLSLLKTVEGDVPLWQRVTALETMKTFCTSKDTGLLIGFYLSPKTKEHNVNLFQTIVQSFSRFVQREFEKDDPPQLTQGSGFQHQRGIDMLGAQDPPTFTAEQTLMAALECLCGIVETLSRLAGTPEHIVAVPRRTSSMIGEGTVMSEAVDRLRVCEKMADCAWPAILAAASVVLAKCSNEQAVQTVLKAYQSFTHTCGLLELVTPRDAFLQSLCKFTIPPAGSNRLSGLSPLSPKCVMAMKTLFNIAYCLGGLLGEAWAMVIETLDSLDRIVHASPLNTESDATTEIKVLGDALDHLFEESKRLDDGAVMDLLVALVTASNAALAKAPQLLEQGPASKAPRLFGVEKLVETVKHNMHRISFIWAPVARHLVQVANNSRQPIRKHSISHLISLIIAALDARITQFSEAPPAAFLPPRRKVSKKGSQEEGSIEAIEPAIPSSEENNLVDADEDLEARLLVPLDELFRCQYVDVREGVLVGLFKILQTCGQALSHAWPMVLAILKSVAVENETALIATAFKSVQLIRNDFLSGLPVECLQLYLTTLGAYGLQTTDVNISLTGLGLLCYIGDFFRKERQQLLDAFAAMAGEVATSGTQSVRDADRAPSTGNVSPLPFHTQELIILTVADSGEPDLSMSAHRNIEQLWLVLYRQLSMLSIDARPEVRHCAIRTLFLTLASQAPGMDTNSWRSSMWEVLFPVLREVETTASKAGSNAEVEVELGKEKGKAVMMLVHHSRNTASKQWDETRVLAITSAATLFRNFFAQIHAVSGAEEMWAELFKCARVGMAHSSAEVANSSIQCMAELVDANAETLNRAEWEEYWDSMKNVLLACCGDADHPPKTLTLLVQSQSDIYSNHKSHVTSADQLVLIETLAAVLTSNFSDAQCPSPTQTLILQFLRQLSPTDDNVWIFLFATLEQHLKEYTDRAMSDPPPVAAANAAKFKATSLLPSLIVLTADLFQSVSSVYVKGRCLRGVCERFLSCMATKQIIKKSQVWRTAAEAMIQIIDSGLDVTLLPGFDAKEVEEIWELLCRGLQTFLTIPQEKVDVESARDMEELDIAIVSAISVHMLPKAHGVSAAMAAKLVSTLDLLVSPLLESNVVFRERLSHVALKAQFTILAQQPPPDAKDDDWAQQAVCVGPLLLQRCATTLRSYASSLSLNPSLPAPREQVAQVVSTLRLIKSLEIHPRVSALLPPSALSLAPSPKKGEEEPENFPMCAVPSGRSHLRPHLFALLPYIIECLNSPQEEIRVAVQEALRVLAWELGTTKVLK